MIDTTGRCCLFSTEWAMPNRWTFQIEPIRRFVAKWTFGCDLIADPFCGESNIATHSNDIAKGGVDAEVWCKKLLETHTEKFDAVIFDPPYSPRQISECYRQIGRKPTRSDTQNAALYARVRRPLSMLLKPGGVALSFGWQSSGFGRQWKTEQILLVQHGGAHNDTICVAQRKPNPTV